MHLRLIFMLFLLTTCVFSPAHAQTPDSLPVVHAVLFWMDGCPACQYVLDEVLPPLQRKYLDQLQIYRIEVATQEDYLLLVQVAEYFGTASRGVPFLIIGDQVLVGTKQIPAELPGLIDDYLAAGGVGYPDVPILKDILPVDLSSENSCPPYAPCAVEDLSTTPLPSSAASVDPSLVPITGTPIPTESPAIIITETPPIPPAEMVNSGFTLAFVVMGLMALSLLYSIIAFAIGKTYSLPVWADRLTPLIIVIAIGVAGYLSYVETQFVVAFCGPVGDCNAVQSSSYAKLFGVLPIGVMGLLGYSAMLIAWLAGKFIVKLHRLATISFFAMAFIGVLFSLYLTYLEPFVIGAVCIWCLTSAILVTVLLMLGLPAVVGLFADAEESN